MTLKNICSKSNEPICQQKLADLQKQPGITAEVLDDLFAGKDGIIHLCKTQEKPAKNPKSKKEPVAPTAAVQKCVYDHLVTPTLAFKAPLIFRCKSVDSKTNINQLSQAIVSAQSGLPRIAHEKRLEEVKPRFIGSVDMAGFSFSEDNEWTHAPQPLTVQSADRVYSIEWYYYMKSNANGTITLYVSTNKKNSDDLPPKITDYGVNFDPKNLHPLSIQVYGMLSIDPPIIEYCFPKFE